MRKSFDGLCGLISSGMQRQATSGEVFVFLNRSRTHMYRLFMDTLPIGTIHTWLIGFCCHVILTSFLPRQELVTEK